MKARASITNLDVSTRHALDKILADQASDGVVGEVLQRSGDDRRIKMQSRYFSLVDSVQAKLDYDLSSLLRDKLNTLLEVEFSKLVGIHQLEKSIYERLVETIDALPFASQYSFVSLVRYLCSERLGLPTITSCVWVNEQNIDRICQLYFLNEQWVLEGIGAPSPSIKHDGIRADLIVPGMEDKGLNFSRSWVYFFKPTYSIKGYITIQVILYKDETGADIISMLPIGVLSKTEVLSVYERTRSLEFNANWAESKGDSINRFMYGETPLSSIFNGAKIDSFHSDFLGGNDAQ